MTGLYTKLTLRVDSESWYELSFILPAGFWGFIWLCIRSEEKPLEISFAAETGMGDHRTLRHHELIRSNAN